MLDDQKELFIVVDENDDIIEYRTRYDCHHDSSLIHRSIGVIIYNGKKEILLQKRSKYKDLNPGKYTISVSGHVTKGQSYEEAAIREMEEELGIKIPIIFVQKFVVKNNQESEMCVTFSGKYNGPFSYAYDEIDSVQFFPKEKIRIMSNKFTPIAWETLRQMHIIENS